MKTQRINKATVLLSMSLAVGAANVQAQSGTWTNSVEIGVWSDAANWLNGVIASGAGNSASFSNEFSFAGEVNLDSSRTLGALQFVQGAYTITNAGNDANVLTLAGGGKPVIHVDAGLGTPATLRRVVLAGTDGFTLDGGGVLNLFKENTDPANILSGSLLLNNGTVQVQGINEGTVNLANNLTLGGISSVTFINGTLNLRPAANTPVEYGNFNANLIVPEGGVGTLVLPPRWSGAAGDNSAAIGAGLGGSLTGSGTLNVDTIYVRPNVVGDWSAFTGQLNIVRNGGPSGEDKQFRVGNPAGLPNASVNLGGDNDWGFVYYPQLTANTVYSIGALSGANPLVQLRGGYTAAFTLFYDIGAKITDPSDVATFAGAIVNSTGPAGLIKRGAGTLILTGENTYSGSTTISNGVLQIGDGFTDMGAIGTGPITNYSKLIFGRGFGTLDVPGAITGPGAITNIGFGGVLILRGANTYTAPTVSTAGKLIVGTASQATGAYILQDAAEGFGTVMTSAGATLTINGLSFSAPGTFDYDLAVFSNPTAAVVTNTGNITLNGDVTVNITGSGLAVGTITLLQYGSRSGSGNFVIGSVPPHVTGYTLNDDTANNRVTLTITATFDDTLKWEGGVTGVWDIDNPANNIWRVVGSGELTNYYDGAKVLFDDTATGTTIVDISTSVAPSSITVNNTTKAYVFTGFGTIYGDTGLTKSGTNKLTVAAANSNAGANRINAGIVEIGDGLVDGNIGTGVITNNGTLLLNMGVGPVTMANPIHGTGNVIQAGPGQVSLSGASTYSGGLTVRPNTILGYNNGNAAGIGGGLRIENATVVLGAGIFNNVGEIVIATNGVFVRTGGNVNIDPPISGTNVTVTFDRSDLLTVNGSIAGISGVITNRGPNSLRFNSGGGNNVTGNANALWVLESGGIQPRNSSVNSLGAVTGTGTISAQQSGNGLTTWEVGALNTSTVFEGLIDDGANFGQLARYTAITKVGTGTWTLSNVPMLHRASTVVSNGTLALTGSSLPGVSTNIVVAAPGVLSVSGRDDGTLTLGAGLTNQVLRGNGTIQGNLVLGANARLEPGFSVGTLTVTGSATLGGVNVMELTTTDGVASDRLVGANINYAGGTLILTNIGNITGSNVFQLFSGGISGSFATVITQNLAGVTWDLSELNANGTVKLVGPPGVSTTPTNITISVSGGTLQLGWPESHKGWTLQAQTNALNVGLSGTWADVEDSWNTNQVFIPIDPANPTVFYRLYLP